MRFIAYTWPDLQLLHTDVPLRDVSVERQVNGVPYLEASLDEATAHDEITIGRAGDWRTVPLIRQHGTLLVSVDGRQNVRSYVVVSDPRDYVEQDTLQILAQGREGEPYKTPWMGDPVDYVEEDPMKIHADIWEHLTSFSDVPKMEIQPASSSVTVGEEERDVSFTDADGNDVEFSAGPWRLRPWAEHDLGRSIDELADRAPFEHRVVTLLDVDQPSGAPAFRLERAYPEFERRELRHLHFEVGLNVNAPQEDDDEVRDYYSHVIVWGSGEGSRRRRGEAHRPGHDRARAVLVVEEQGLTSNEACIARAKALLGLSRSERFYDTVTVSDSFGAPFGSFDIGDVIWIKTPQLDGETHVQAARIQALQHQLRTQTMTLSLVPANADN